MKRIKYEVSHNITYMVASSCTSLRIKRKEKYLNKIEKYYAYKMSKK
jgi:hypothetical protein